MAEIIKLDEFRQPRKARKPKSKSGLKPKKFGKGHKGPQMVCIQDRHACDTDRRRTDA
jgi:hypothetical protein